MFIMPYKHSAQRTTSAGVQIRDVGVQTDIDNTAIQAVLQRCRRGPPAAPVPVPQRAPFATLPDELVERIFEALAEFLPGTIERAEGLGDGWWDEPEVFPETLEREYNLRQLRLVCRDFLHLVTPIYMRWFSVMAPASRPCWPHSICMEADHHADARKIIFLLSSSPPPRVWTGEDHRKPLPAYGTYVRDLAFVHRAISSHLGRIVLERLAELMPNLRNLHLYTASGTPPSAWSELISARLPYLEAITEIELPRVDRTGVHGQHEESPHQEVIFRLLDRHPHIRKLSAIAMGLEGASAERLITILTTNRLYHWPGERDPAGLTLLHLASGCVVEIFFLDALRTAAPNLVQLTIGAECELVDTKNALSRFSLADLVSALPCLRHFTFIGQKSLPGSEVAPASSWAYCGNLLAHCPRLNHLDLRVDCLSPEFFHSLRAASGPPHLLHQRLRFLALHCSSNHWSEVVILPDPRRIRIFLTITDKWFGDHYPWPTSSIALKDLFSKLNWMTSELESAVDDKVLKMVVEVRLDGSAVAHLAPVGADGAPGVGAEDPPLAHAVCGSSAGVCVRREEWGWGTAGRLEGAVDRAGSEGDVATDEEGGYASAVE